MVYDAGAVPIQLLSLLVEGDHVVVNIPWTPQVEEAVQEPADTYAQTGQGVAGQEGELGVVEGVVEVPTQLAAFVELGDQVIFSVPCTPQVEEGVQELEEV